MSKLLNVSILFIAALNLAGCNSQPAPQQQVYAEPARSRLVSNPNFKLPEGSGCSGAIARYRALIDNDLEVGHTVKSVHTEMSGDIDNATNLCSSGNDAGARQIISSSRSRHGYPVS